VGNSFLRDYFEENEKRMGVGEKRATVMLGKDRYGSVETARFRNVPADHCHEIEVRMDENPLSG